MGVTLPAAQSGQMGRNAPGAGCTAGTLAETAAGSCCRLQLLAIAQSSQEQASVDFARRGGSQVEGTGRHAEGLGEAYAWGRRW